MDRAPIGPRSAGGSRAASLCGTKRTVLRRVGVILVLAGLGGVLGLPLLRGASRPRSRPRGVRLVGSRRRRDPSGAWQAWANASRVPTVTGTVTLRLTGCPGLPKAAGCVYTRQPRVVYLKPGLTHPRAVMLHELGHVYDLTVFSNADRGMFRRIMKVPHRRWWSGKRRWRSGSRRRTPGARATRRSSRSPTTRSTSTTRRPPSIATPAR